MKKEIKQEAKWYKLLSREGVDLTTISQIDLVFYDLIGQATKHQAELFFTILKGQQLTHYIGVNPEEVGRYCYQKYFNSPKQIIKHYEDGKLLLSQIKKDALKYHRLLIKEPTKNNFLAAYKNFRKGFKKINYIYSIISWLGIEAWQIDFEQILNKLIADNHLEKETGRILSTIYKPWKKTALIEIQEKLAQGKNPKKLAAEYQFLRNWSAVWYKPLTEEWVKSIKSKNKKEKLKFYSSKKLLGLLKPNKKEKIFLDIAQYIVFFKDWRDDARRLQVYYWAFLFDLLGERFDISRDDIGYFTLDELETIIQTGILDKNIIKKRKNGCVIVPVKNKLAEVFNEIPLKYSNIAKQVEQGEQEKIVRGKIAQMGIARGIVKVIRSYHDIKRVQKGDILVANTTHPGYLPAMQKAAAFITNEGGVISHAAIVARELKKPCIVGTGNATHILLEGDFVEVDANKGIVKILKR